MKVLNRLFQKLLFNDGLEYYKTRSGAFIGVNALCASRTLKALCSLGELTAVSKVEKIDICIYRSEEKRILSAYNKKVLSNNDWKKIILRKLNNLYFGMEFNEFLEVLIERKKRGMFIDKHFAPCFLGGVVNVSIDNKKALCSALEIDNQILNDLHVASSESVISKHFELKQSLTPSELNLLNQYLDLYE